MSISPWLWSSKSSSLPELTLVLNMSQFNKNENIQFTIKYKKVHPTYVQQITFNNEKKFGYDYNGTPCCDVYANAYKKQWNTFIDAIRNINVEANRERLFGYSKTFDSVETVAKLLSVECL